jgi:competence protein ComEA
MKRDMWLLAFGLVGGLLGAGLLYLAAGRPHGPAVQLSPPPTSAPILVHVSGGVVNPGVYALPLDSRVQDAVQAAGGLAPEAMGSSLNLAARVRDGDQLIIPTLRPTSLPVLSTTQAETGGTRFQAPLATEQPTQAGKININSAGLEELDTLPGIGPVTAQKIIDYRQANGPFQTLEAIMDVSGIGPATFERLKDLITVDAVP